MCELFAFGEQGVRAADCKSLSEKPVRGFPTVSVPREQKLPGDSAIYGKMDQAISLTVMLTSGIASVALLTVISPDLICAFSAS